MPIVADTSVWIEWLNDQPGADRFSVLLAGPEVPIVPSIVIYEVLRWYRAKGLIDETRKVAAVRRQGKVVSLSADVAEAAVGLAAAARLAMADAMILATAHAQNAELWTQDADFAAIPGVRYFPKVMPRP